MYTILSVSDNLQIMCIVDELLGPQRDLTSDEKPLLIQRRWEPNGQKCFRIKVKPSTELQVSMEMHLHILCGTSGYICTYVRMCNRIVHFI